MQDDDLFNFMTNAESIQTSGTQALSDTSSDSGCNFEQQILSPEPSVNNASLDLLKYMQEDEDEDESPVHVNPRTNSPDSEIITLPSSFETGATTIILPVISPVCTNIFFIF